jgi:tetratricopeptide (TPR) repeat protein
MSPTEYAQKIRLAEVYEETHDEGNAARVYEDLYRANPSDETVFEGLTRSLVYLKRYEEAEKIAKDKLQHDGSLNVLLLYARLEALMNKRQDALDAFHKAELATNAKDCQSVFPIVYAMMDVSYNQDALELLDRMRKITGDDADICSSQIAGLYLRLGEFDRASSEFITILKSGEGNVGMVEQRLAQYMTDSLSRQTVLNALETQILAAQQTPATLRLLAWLYSEKKDYADALATIVKLDNMADKSNRGNQGYELLQFADRVRSEGALDVAVKAYDEAISRLKSSDNARQSYFISQAELGALKTKELYYLSRPHSSDSVAQLVTRYEQYAASEQQGDLSLDALVHAGDLAFHELFNFDRATKDYERALTKSNGLNETAQHAAFGLVEVAVAAQNFPLAESRLSAIGQQLERSKPANELAVRDRILFERGRSDYYQLQFDSAVVYLNEVANDASSDYANDAIQLAGLIQDNITSGISRLKIFAKAARDENSHKYALADSEYQSLADNGPLADRAAMRSAEMLVKLGRPADGVNVLETMQEKMVTSPLLDDAAFREAEIVERELHDKARAQKMYEDFLAKYPNSIFVIDARERARKLRGDAF